MPASVLAFAGDSTITSSRLREPRRGVAPSPLAEAPFADLRLVVVFVVFFVGIRGAMSLGIYTVLLDGNLSGHDEAHRADLAHYPFQLQDCQSTRH